MDETVKCKWSDCAEDASEWTGECATCYQLRKLNGNLGGLCVEPEPKRGLWKTVADWLWKRTGMDPYVFAMGGCVAVLCFVGWWVL
jgi:hypothetical protein